MQQIRTGRHCTFALHAHLVFVTKFRHKVFTDAHLRRMEEIMRDVAKDFECKIVEFNGENNHVHLLVNFPPKVALSKLVNSLKGVSSRRLRQEYPELVRHYWRAQRLWSGSSDNQLRSQPPKDLRRRPLRPASTISNGTIRVSSREARGRTGPWLP
ncbi:IS200/IS605 family transposase [Streptomyces sp. NBC_01017]